MADLKPDVALVVAPVETGWPVRAGTFVCSLTEALNRLNDFFRPR